MMMSDSALSDALYYLRNFKQAIHWVVERNSDLLSIAERTFASEFNALPIPAQALLARLSMRRGVLFRRSKIRYAEIEPLGEALAPLIERGWVDARPSLHLEALFRLCTRAELAGRFGDRMARLNKSEAYEALLEEYDSDRTFQAWLNTEEAVYHVTIAPIVLQFRLLHFGNFYQAWHEYTLAHLQIFKYEPVPIDPASRPFESREEIELFYALYGCYESMSEGATLAEVIAQLPAAPAGHGWLRRRWDRLRYALAKEAERAGELQTAYALYRGNGEPDARVRQVRLLECLKRDEEALQTAQAILAEDPSELIAQQVGRIVTRLQRRRGATPVKRQRETDWRSIQLELTYDPDQRVETRVLTHFSSADAPVYYVENSLLCSMFGLLCWDALFQPIRGAFFHPFQSAPADLYCPGFVARRRAAFETCLQRLDSGEHGEAILRTFVEKHGTSAPFVHWSALEASLLELALTCISAAHLKLYFARLLDDLSENASGLPDLVQFFPATRRYKFIEVKGPGDRVQDNQRRWLQFCARHQLPVEVCQVRWVESAMS